MTVSKEDMTTTSTQAEFELLIYLGTVAGDSLDESERSTVLQVVRQVRVLTEQNSTSESGADSLCADKFREVGTPRMSKISDWYAEKSRELDPAILYEFLRTVDRHDDLLFLNRMFGRPQPHLKYMLSGAQRFKDCDGFEIFGSLEGAEG